MGLAPLSQHEGWESSSILMRNREYDLTKGLDSEQEGNREGLVSTSIEV